jgi:hypothetical protein
MPFVLVAKTDVPSEVVADFHADTDALWLVALWPNFAAEDDSDAGASNERGEAK